MESSLEGLCCLVWEGLGACMINALGHNVSDGFEGFTNSGQCYGRCPMR